MILVQRLKLVALETACYSSESRAHLWSHLLSSLHVHPGGANCHLRPQSCVPLWQHIYQARNEFRNTSMTPMQEVIDLF